MKPSRCTVVLGIAMTASSLLADPPTATGPATLPTQEQAQLSELALWNKRQAYTQKLRALEEHPSDSAESLAFLLDSLAQLDDENIYRSGSLNIPAGMFIPLPGPNARNPYTRLTDTPIEPGDPSSPIRLDIQLLAAHGKAVVPKLLAALDQRPPHAKRLMATLGLIDIDSKRSRDDERCPPVLSFNWPPELGDQN